jgi:uncharacterized protein (DUF1499 family)/multisubunit Na+/H+ antiporter MnhF subunit
MDQQHAAALPSRGRAAGAASGWAWAGLWLAIVCVAAELLAGPGYRLRWWGLNAGLQTIRWAATVAAVAIVATLAIALWAQLQRARRALVLALVAFVLSVAAAAPPAYFWYQVTHLPHLHDVTTDTEHPPRFAALLALRTGARNSAEYDPATAARQHQGYPDLVPLTLETSPAQALQLAERVARSMGWDIVAVTPGAWRLEATATSLLFGFKDDIVVRIAAQGSESRVDVRSVSRIGGSDFGANARRIRSFLGKLKAAGPHP